MHVELDVLQGYLTKLHAREGWRMRSWAPEDYVQEGVLQYCLIEKHYAGRGAKPCSVENSRAKAAVHFLLSSAYRFTLAELVAASGATEVSIKTALSDLKNPKYAKPFEPLDIVKFDGGFYGLKGVEEPKTVTEPKHFMALFKTHWQRYIHDKSKKEFVTEADDLLTDHEAAAVLFGIEQETALQHLSADARALVTLFCSPGEVVTDLIKGIQFTTYQARKLAARLAGNRPGITVERVRRAVAEILKEFDVMATPIQQLATATGLIQQQHEKREPYLIRLIEGVSQLKEEAWDALPKEAQDAANAMIAAHNEKKPLIGSAEGTEETPAAIAPKKAANGSRKPPARAKSGAPAAAQTSPTGRARVIMTLDATLTGQDVAKQLEKEGIKPPAMATLQVMRSETKHVLRILKEHNLLVGNPPGLEDKLPAGAQAEAEVPADNTAAA